MVGRLHFVMKLDCNLNLTKHEIRNGNLGPRRKSRGNNFG